MTEQRSARTVAQMEALAPRVHNGTYTVSHPQRGHFTVKVSTALKGDLAGKRIVSLLAGPDNTRDFKGVGFFFEDGTGPSHRGPQVVLWRRYRTEGTSPFLDGWQWDHRWGKVEQKLAIWTNLVLRPGTYWSQEGYELLLAGTCVVCNRKLTDPDSIRLGIGPVCANR